MIVQFVQAERVCSTITNEDDKCFSDRQFSPRFAAIRLSSICRCRIAFIEYFEQLWRGRMKSQPVTRGAFCHVCKRRFSKLENSRSPAHWTTVKCAAVSNAPHSADELRSRASTRQSARGVAHYVLKENNFGELAIDSSWIAQWRL